MEETRKKKTIAMAAIIVAAILIAVSVVALVTQNTSNSDANSQTEQSSEIAKGNESNSTSDAKDGANSNKSGDSTSKSDSSDGNDASTDNNSTYNENAGSGDSGNANTHGNHRGSGSSSGNSSTDSSISDTNSADNTENDDSHFSVYITIDGAGYGNVSFAGNVTLNEGANVYDALMATGISVNARDSQYGTYVAAIGGLAEKAAGGESGWKYSVNGVEPQTSCSNYKLKSGDVVKWKFVTRASESIG